jgi:hypothetical protein
MEQRTWSFLANDPQYDNLYASCSCLSCSVSMHMEVSRGLHELIAMIAMMSLN